MTPNELLAGLLKLELKLHAMLLARQYSVFRTNADLEEIQFIGTYNTRDIAESVMMQKFIAQEGVVDYMLVEAKSHELICTAFSPRTMILRNECQG